MHSTFFMTGSLLGMHKINGACLTVAGERGAIAWETLPGLRCPAALLFISSA
jgi:hypothetical protein